MLGENMATPVFCSMYRESRSKISGITSLYFLKICANVKKIDLIFKYYIISIFRIAFGSVNLPNLDEFESTPIPQVKE